MKIAVSVGRFSLARLQERLRRLEQVIHETLVTSDPGRVHRLVLRARRDETLPVRTAEDE